VTEVSTLRPLLALLATAALLAAACGGGTDGETSDAGALEELRNEVEVAAVEAASLESLLTGAFVIATRNAGEPLGAEAFAFAEEVALENMWTFEEGPFSSLAPEPPDGLAGTDAHVWRALAGFIVAAPAPYEATAVFERLHREFMETADNTIDELKWAADSRTTWAGELLAGGETAGSWWGLVARLDGGTSASMGAKNAEDYAAGLVQLAYYRDLAAGAGEPAEFLAAWDLLIAAVELAAYEPPQLRTEYRDGKFITTYTEEAATGGAANARQLTEAVAAVRPLFPETEE
jgi:hypothetical protein